MGLDLVNGEDFGRRKKIFGAKLHQLMTCIRILKL